MSNRCQASEFNKYWHKKGIVIRGDNMITARQTALETLHLYKGNFSIQQYKTLKGQIYAGDIPGFYRGVNRLLGKTRVVNSRNNAKGVIYGEKNRKKV